MAMVERRFQELPAWQRAQEFALAIADLRDSWPEGAYPDLIEETCNDAVTVPVKIASGSLPLLDPDWPGGSELAQNLSTARMALRYVDTRLELGHRFGCIDRATLGRFLAMSEEVRRLIDDLIERSPQPALVIDRFHPPFSEN
jgi:hypothetical protein